MTKKDLIKAIEEEVAKVANEPVREPAKEIIQQQPISHKPVLNNEEEIDEYLFRAGMKKH